MKYFATTFTVFFACSAWSEHALVKTDNNFLVIESKSHDIDASSLIGTTLPDFKRHNVVKEKAFVTSNHRYHFQMIDQNSA